jgi:hypothetical protein
MQVSFLFPAIIAILVLLLMVFALFGAAIKNLFTKKTTTPLNARRQVVFKPASDGGSIATRKTIAVPFIEPTRVPALPDRILPSRQLLMAEAVKSSELVEEQLQMAKRARKPMVLPPR